MYQRQIYKYNETYINAIEATKFAQHKKGMEKRH